MKKKSGIRKLKITRNIYAISTALVPFAGFLLLDMPKDIPEYVAHNAPILLELPPVVKDVSVLAGVCATMVYSAYNTYQANKEIKEAKKR